MLLFRHFALSVISLAVLLSLPTAYAMGDEVTDMNSHSWDAFTLHYPSKGWGMKVLRDQEKLQAVQFTHRAEPEILVTIYLARGGPQQDPKYLERPHMSSVSGVLSAATHASGDDGARMFFGTGSMLMPNGMRPSSLATVISKDGLKAVHFEGCHERNLESGHGLYVTITSYSTAGQLSDDPGIPTVFEEAYKIVSSVELNLN